MIKIWKFKKANGEDADVILFYNSSAKLWTLASATHKIKVNYSMLRSVILHTNSIDVYLSENDIWEAHTIAGEGGELNEEI